VPQPTAPPPYRSTSTNCPTAVPQYLNQLPHRPTAVPLDFELEIYKNALQYKTMIIFTFIFFLFNVQ
jgi:hypothetical protein